MINLYTAIEQFAKSFGDIIIAVCAGSLTFTFILGLFLSILKINFGYKRRAVLLCGQAFVIVIALSAVLLGGTPPAIVGGLTLFYALSWYVIMAVPVKRVRVTDEQKNLIKFIDESIRSRALEEPDYGNKKQVERSAFGGEYFKEARAFGGEEKILKTVPAQETPPKEGYFGLDFSHVKNVIARLDYYSLNQTDRKQVHDLEAYLLQAERRGADEEVKEKINEGLSSLLKIMSKYGA